MLTRSESKSDSEKIQVWMNLQWEIAERGKCQELGIRSQIFRQIRDVFEESRGLDHVLGMDSGDAHQGGESLIIQEGKELVGRLASVDRTGDGVDVGEDEVDGVLRKIVKGGTFGNDVAE